jgi:hypothetical protein
MATIPLTNKLPFIEAPPRNLLKKSILRLLKNKRAEERAAAAKRLFETLLGQHRAPEQRLSALENLVCGPHAGGKLN